MTKHTLEYEIGYTTDETFCIIAKLSTSPKSEMCLNEIIKNTDRLLDFGFISKFLDVIISLDGMEIPGEYHDQAITIEAMYTILKEQKEGDSNVNS